MTMANFDITDEDEQAEDLEVEVTEEAEAEEVEQSIKEEINESDRDYDTRDVTVPGEEEINPGTVLECHHFSNCRVICVVLKQQ